PGRRANVMAVDRVTAFLDELQELSLLTPAQLDELRRSPPSNLQNLAKQLVLRGWLTRFQAKHLLQGHSKQLVVGPYRLLDAVGPMACSTRWARAGWGRSSRPTTRS